MSPHLQIFGWHKCIPTLDYQALYPQQIPRQGEEPVLFTWALLPPHGMPPILVPLCLILCPHTRPSGHPLGQPASRVALLLWPCFLGLAPLPSAQPGSSRAFCQPSQEALGSQKSYKAAPAHPPATAFLPQEPPLISCFILSSSSSALCTPSQ